MDGWLHETMDWLCLTESKAEIHQFKDSPSQVPEMGPKHRAVRHSEWKEWARNWNLDAYGPEDVLKAGNWERLLADYAHVPAHQVPKLIHRAWLDAVISVGHEAYDELWSQFDKVTRDEMNLYFANFVLNNGQWSPDVLKNPRFHRLQEYVQKFVLPQLRKI